ncbi:MAG: MBL fold metallo-hydrolase [Eubacteriales bacterium]|nr:MBL fold metallo-hydrolase [Eubacteriales bacterium]
MAGRDNSGMELILNPDSIKMNRDHEIFSKPVKYALIFAITVMLFSCSFFAGCSIQDPENISGISDGNGSQVSGEETVAESSAEETMTQEEPTDDSDENEEGSFRLFVHYINVGDGECILIKPAGGPVMLIGAGSDSSEQVVINYLKNEGIEKIDYLVLTTPRPDIIGGADALLYSFDVGEIYAPAVGNDDASFDDLFAALRDKDKKPVFIKAGTEIDMGPEITADVIAPFSRKYDNLGNYSIVIYLKYNLRSFIFTGDSEWQLQREILSKGIYPDADLIKISGKAGINSLAPEFLDAVTPDAAVISLRRSDDGRLPSGDVIKNLEERNVRILRTDQQGHIIAASDGQVIRYNVDGIEGEDNWWDY